MRYFTPATKLSDALTANYNLLMLLPRLGIKFGFGDRNIAQVCALNGSSPTFVTMVLNTYTFSDYTLDATLLTTDDAKQMREYLIASHHYYTSERIPHISRHLDHVASHIGERYAAALRTFFEGYCKDIIHHLDYEEQTIFPLVERRIGGERIPRQVLTRFARTHDDSVDSVDKLSDLMQILFKYLPSDGLAEELNELAFTILQLSSDINKHALIEDQVLIPYLLGTEAPRQ